MFFQAIATFLLIFIALWAIWQLFVKNLLRSSGVDIDSDIIEPFKEESLTSQEKRLEGLKKEFDAKSKDAQAAEAGVTLAREIKFLEDRIKEANEKMKGE